jgi:hypothetical protein
MAATGNSCFWLKKIFSSETFLWSFTSFGQTVSEEKNFENQPIRNKNHLWWPCLLMDRDEMSNLYRGPSIDASYHVSVHLARVSEEKIKMWKVNGRQTMDAKWWQKLTLPFTFVIDECILILMMTFFRAIHHLKLFEKQNLSLVSDMFTTHTN